MKIKLGFSLILKLTALPLTRGLAKPQVLTEGEKETNSKNNLLSVIKTIIHHI